MYVYEKSLGYTLGVMEIARFWSIEETAKNYDKKKCTIFL